MKKDYQTPGLTLYEFQSKYCFAGDGSEPGATIPGGGGDGWDNLSSEEGV
ncbi:MAG: hypothetical protein LBQ48_08570 [Oscillospiraceae bacterium]|jgi:hypothetical protein|nr:hypothetical protein [Oscillospiraceae bacterium]